MADTSPPAGQRSANMLTRKAGPFPVWVWAAIGVGLYYWYTRKGPGASGTSQQAVDPNTGVPYAQELAAAQQQSGEPVTLDVTVTDTDQKPPRVGAPPPREPCPLGMVRDPKTGRCVPQRKPPPRRRPKGPIEIPAGTAQGPGAAPAARSASRGPLDRPGEVNTVNGSPVYDQWAADHAGVPEPQLAYAPMTAGSIYG